MYTRDNNHERATAGGLPASMFEGMFDDADADPARLRAWGLLAVALLRAGRGHLLELPVFDDAPFDALPPDDAAADNDAPCCGADDEAGEPETPAFDIIGSVRGMQERLRWLGFLGAPATNVLDDTTRQALAAFQEQARLPISAYPDQATRDALMRRTIW